MVKVIIFFKRKPGMLVEDFQKHWRTTHADTIVRLPGIRKYIQSHVLSSAYCKGEPVCDGVAESYFDDIDAMKKLAKTPEYAAVLADEPNFIDGPSIGTIITEKMWSRMNQFRRARSRALTSLIEKRICPSMIFRCTGAIFTALFVLQRKRFGAMCRTTPIERSTTVGGYLPMMAWQ